jgi:hypothetical protein
MAEKLSVQIALEGGKEIEQQLADIGKAGQKAFSDISGAAAQVGGFNNLDPGVVTKAIVDLGVKGPEAINKITDAVKTATRFETMVNAVKAVENAFTNLGTTVAKVITLFGKHEAASAGLGRAGVRAAVMLGEAFGPIGVIILGIIAVLVVLGTTVLKVAESLQKIDAEAIGLGTTFEVFTKLRTGLLAVGITAEAVSQGFKELQSSINSVTLAAIEKAVTDAQKNIAAGWPPTTAQLKLLTTAANSVVPAIAAAGQAALKSLGQPFNDRVTPALQAMVQWAGSATKAIPLLGNELKNLGTAGERSRLVAGLIDQIKVESGDAAKAMLPLMQLLEQMPKGADRDRAAIQAFGEAMGTQVAQALNLGKSISQIIQDAPAMAQSQADAANKIVQAWNAMKAAATGAFENIPIGQATQALGTVTTSVNQVGTAFGTAATASTSAIGEMVTAMGQLIDKLTTAVGLTQQLSAGGGAAAAAPGHASGGLIGGRGTGTSDSNLAWVSRGEHIMPARAVSQPGVLAFLEALRRTGGNLTDLLNGMGHFALGGLVGAPSFAAGGVNSMSHVTIAFPGLPAIGGLRASSSVVEELRKAAGLAQVRSGGRKPSRYG